MSFEQTEYSLAAGRPLRLYRFSLGVLRMTYSSSDRDVVHAGEVFKTLPGGIKDSGVRQTGQVQADVLKITAPANIEVAQLYRGVPPSAPVELTIFARHQHIDEFMVIWAGEVRSVRWPAVDRCELSCSSLAERMQMVGLRLGYERNCPHAVGTPACGVELDGYKVVAPVQDIDGASISNGQFAGYPDGYFTGGSVEWEIAGGQLDSRGVEAHVGATLTLLGGTAGLVGGQAITVYPGCSQTVASCKRFNNLPRYGGIPHLAGKSPWDGSNVF